MMYLTAQHTNPPRVITHEGTSYPVLRLIELGDTATLAMLGVYPHETAEGDAPLGYTDWVLDNGIFIREPAGTQTERDAYYSRLKWRAQAVIRQRKTLQALIDAPDTDPAARVAALQQLQELR